MASPTTASQHPADSSAPVSVAAREPRAATRLGGLDALRGLAVLLMIEQHLGVWLWRGPAPGKHATDYPGLLLFNGLGGAAAPLFITLAGVGVTLMASGRPGSDARLLKRGLILLGFAFLLSLSTPSWFTWRSWFVLHLMAAGMIFAPALRRVSDRGLIALAVIVLGCTPLLQTWLDTPMHLSNPRMAGYVKEMGSDILPFASLRIAAAEGQFPIFPWFAFFLTGMWAGRHANREGARKLAALGGTYLGTGAVLALCFYVLKLPFARSHPRYFAVSVPFFPASPAFVLLLAGAILVVVAAMMRSSKVLADDHPMVCLGRVSLTLLLLHVPLFREATRPVGLWQSLSASNTLAILIGVAAVSVVAAVYWRRIDYRYGAEWLMRKLSDPRA